MAPQAAQSKSTSRWGSLLQQAIAGVESRLDTILADDDKTGAAVSRRELIEQPGKKEAMNMPVATKLDSGVPRRASLNKKNDRLQERLAKVVVSRKNTKSASASGLSSRAESPSRTLDSPRASLETTGLSIMPGFNSTLPDTDRMQEHTTFPLPSNTLQADEKASHKPEVCSSAPLEAPNFVLRLSSEPHESISSRPSLQSSQSGSDRASVTVFKSLEEPPEATEENVIAQMHSDFEAAELRRHEEKYRYLEHIDALQAKLHYFTKEAAQTAKEKRLKAETGGLEDQLAIKDEKIALLLEEGQKLSQIELQHMSTIKELRAKSTEDQKSLKQGLRFTAELETTLKSAQDQARQAEAYQRGQFERRKALQKLEGQIDRIKLENRKKDSEIADLRQQVGEAQNAKEADEVSGLKRLLEIEQKATLELRDVVLNVESEKNSGEERFRARYRELQDQATHDTARAGVTEMELRKEIGVLESRLESFRTRTEAFSSGTSNDTQAKLLRQIETLQTQYSVASENWRGIEGSLLARISNLETERDDIAKREGDIRRKARTMGNKCRQLEIQIEQSTSHIQELEQQISSQVNQLLTSNEAQAAAEAEVTRLREEERHEKEHWQARLDEQLETERRTLHPYPTGVSSPQLHADFPSSSNRPRGHTDKASPHARRHLAGSNLGLVGGVTSFPERLVTTRNSGQPLQFSGARTPHRQDSLASTPQTSVYNGIPEPPSCQTDNQVDFFDGNITPATPERTINDMFSASTAAAGPSVQLVERMSAAVRRLESEKAASREELDRLSAQRDEAREQVVALMREAEEKRAADAKNLELETEMTEMNQRYQTTLEMLGEKSELVEELQADITDVKQMYRDLVNSTMQ
ncbi:hypothetical protein MMC13_004256 [Lambiella insularis]|nr:hypothetical protein [Lambiella insularis]